MTSTKNWWDAEINWETPTGDLLRKFLALLPPQSRFQIVLYGSDSLQLTLALARNLQITNRCAPGNHSARHRPAQGGLWRGTAGLQKHSAGDLDFL
jgi:hypothetical protein